MVGGVCPDEIDLEDVGGLLVDVRFADDILVCVTASQRAAYMLALIELAKAWFAPRTSLGNQRAGL